MTTPNKQFDPFLQVDQMSAEIDLWIQHGRAMIERTAWVIGKMREENERLQAERDDVEIYTEQEAAVLLRIGHGDKAFTTLADLRARLRLPHMKIGKNVRYTKRHITEIVGMLEINAAKNNRNVAGHFRKAA